MLNTLKLAQKIQKSMPDLYDQIQEEQICAQKVFDWLLEHPEALAYTEPHEVPQIQGALSDAITVVPQQIPYGVIATDGSQIYPDKHQGITCYVLNTGTAQFIYQKDIASASLSSEPDILTLHDESLISDDIVTCNRAEREFEEGFIASEKLKEQNPDLPFLYLCDGSLIFWHLENKSPVLKERFLKKYLEQLYDFYTARIPMAGYISLPKSKDLLRYLKNSIAHKKGPVLTDESFATVVDTDLIQSLLGQRQRTALFIPTSPLLERYPAKIRPCFVYLHVGHEIARIEVPRWVADDAALFTTVLSLILDQSIKGNGYPVALSEAHEQAVIKGHERQHFFRLLQRLEKRSLTVSQKSLKKRYVSV